jgi:protein TonB
MRSLILLLTILSVNAYAQTTKKGTIKVKKVPKNEVVYSIVDQMPVFQDGDAGLMRFLQRNLTYPQRAKEESLSGVVHMTFVVNQDGSITEVKVLKGIPNCPECDMEAFRAVSSMPPFKPGMKNGAVVRVQFNLPIKFSLR